ncbi:hypothetical protein F4819DRAFT_24367 [Hypoxylon fuscum]|nr:hypothetical protein F4819DRAFT_24367 [Hypoxylon fuscum]
MISHQEQIQTEDETGTLKGDSSSSCCLTDESTSITTDGYESESLSTDSGKSDNQGDGCSTSLTSISEKTTIYGDKEVSRKCDCVVGRSRAGEELFLPDLISNGRTSSQKFDSNRPGADAETDNNSIDLDEGDARHSLQITHTHRWVDAVLAHPPYYHCKTQLSLLDFITSINLGFIDTVYRWAPGSKIRYNVNYSSFPEKEYGEYAALCLDEAAEKWNRGSIGVVFEKVEDHAPAVFQLVYSTRQSDGLLARSFMPRGAQEQQDRLYVYASAFDKEKGYYNGMMNIFCHELGHILGLRHEFAKSSPKEQKAPSVQWGPANALSVMNYFKNPGEMRIQETDYNEVRRFYEFRGKEYSEFKIVDMDPKCFDSPQLSSFS